MVKFPTSRGAAIRSFNSKVPRLKYKRGVKGPQLPTGTRLSKYGKTPEEKLAQYAPEGSTPERMVYGWLVTHHFQFTFQEPFQGGRLPGGAVLDFVVYDRNPPIVIRVQSYWHDSASAQLLDTIQMEALLEMGYVVEDVWEREINTVERVQSKMMEILYGAPKRRG